MNASSPFKNSETSELDELWLPRSVFTEICSGQVSTLGIEILRKGQYSLRRLRLRALLGVIPEIRNQLGPFSAMERAWTVLAEAEQRDARAVEDVLMTPSVGVRLARALRQAVGAAFDMTSTRAELGWFHAVAAAAAVRSRLPCVLSVPVVHGAACLPTVGRFQLPVSFPAGHAEVHVTTSTISLTACGGTVALSALEPVRRHRSTARGRDLDVIVDAVNPYRTFSSPAPAGHFRDVDYAAWTKLLDEAWDLLTQWHPGYAEELAAGLDTLVPLPAKLGVFAASSSAAFGAIAMSPKRSATEFAEALVHELQHSKLNALFDLVVLSSPGNHPWLYAPWRDEPRTLSSLLHGIYAFVSVVEFWDLQRALVPPAETRQAQFAFGLRTNQLRRVIDTVQARPELTDLGREFVTAVSSRLAARMPAELPRDISTAIEQLTADHYATWRMCHVRPRPDRVSHLADDWLIGRPVTVDSEEDWVVRAQPSGASPRTVLLKMRAVEPDQFERLPQDGPDAAFVRGEHDVATAGYLGRIHTAPTDIAAWVGLGLALNSPALLRTPELVRAVYLRISASTGIPPDPLDLVTWFDRSGQTPG